jgi:8-oxo-dGTP pyrophosphatase MutT (NUDIX family)
VASLARKRMAATAFFRDEDGRVLLVNPVHKETWDLPGGAVEAEESPYAACRREVAEELGLARSRHWRTAARLADLVAAPA